MTPGQLSLLTRGEAAINGDDQHSTHHAPAGTTMADADELEAFARSTGPRR